MKPKYAIFGFLAYGKFVVKLLFIIKSSNQLAKFYKKYYTINISIFQADKINISKKG